MESPLLIAEEVRTALAAGAPVVALETSVVAQGLPPPANLEAARRCAAAVRRAGAVPAAIAVLEGRIVVGAGEAELARLAEPARRPGKAGARDLAAFVAQRASAGTTVSATCAVAARVGIRFFATGGIGGVHRRADPLEPLDVSADLAALARFPVCVVCAGPKVILDLAATLEHLETAGVPVFGWRTHDLPAFYSDRSGLRLEHALHEAEEAARILRVHWEALVEPTAVLVCNPPPSPLPRDEVESALRHALREAGALRLPGKEVTPFLLAALSRATGGRTQAANLELLESNAALAGGLAKAYAGR